MTGVTGGTYVRSPGNRVTRILKGPHTSNGREVHHHKQLSLAPARNPQTAKPAAPSCLRPEGWRNNTYNVPSTRRTLQ